MKKTYGGNIFLKNKLVLYIFVFLALIDVYNHLLYNDTKTLFVLIIAGYITSLFTENMTVVLIIALVVSNVFKQTMDPNEYYKNMRENFENKDEGSNDNNETENDNDDNFKNEDINTKETLSDAQQMVDIQEKLINNLEKMTPYVEKMETFANKYAGNINKSNFQNMVKQVKQSVANK